LVDEIANTGARLMASTTNQVNEAAQDAKEQIAQLRKQVESLMTERVTPVLADAAGRAESAARQASEFTRDQAEMVSSRVRDQPLVAILVAAAGGYLLGRLFR
jgi:ElaB/YqjD/DUF883 family membrane-anchored ribosome-binding protein